MVRPAVKPTMARETSSPRSEYSAASMNSSRLSRAREKVTRMLLTEPSLAWMPQN
ncbi:hypothetical protein B2K_40405 [Paenibacillus mucilaginosus K02]|uniref:Uncharacterized protein n=1 Tax=Paenibacillus mucilaginosus K02 TaxID=997761 RepID=R9UQ82_9BACL|nr:hypothetical protein B2K_40405 [Paenibacillus mucilaginosus K02]